VVGIIEIKQVETGPLQAALAEGSGIREAVSVSADRSADERRWVERARQADASAFEQLYRANVDRVYGLCLRMTGERSEAEDCVQEAFIQAWNKLDKFRGDAAFGTWMHRVAVNVVLGRMRKSKREQDRIRAVSEVAPAREAIADDGELRDLEQAINELPRGARHVFVLHAVYGYSHGETGDMLGIAEGTSKAQLNRARRLLTQQLETERQ
jgi:RNA polymerase sigma-70 factor (ECF subfamily)